MVGKEIRFYREQAEKLRELARLTDEVRRRLTDFAAECDDRARQVENLAAEPKIENRLPRLSRPSQTTEPFTLSIKDTARLLGLGRTTIYRLIGDRQLETVKVGNRTLIKTASIRSLVEIQPD
jgi:excisionase family DNA binding protein